MVTIKNIKNAMDITSIVKAVSETIFETDLPKVTCNIVHNFRLDCADTYSLEEQIKHIYPNIKFNFKWSNKLATITILF